MNLLECCFNILVMINFGENNISLELKMTTCFYENSTVYDYENSSITIINCFIYKQKDFCGEKNRTTLVPSL